MQHGSVSIDIALCSASTLTGSLTVIYNMSAHPSVAAAMMDPTYDSNRSAPMPAVSPTLSPTQSAMTAGLRGSSSGMPASTCDRLLVSLKSTITAWPVNSRYHDLPEDVSSVI